MKLDDSPLPLSMTSTPHEERRKRKEIEEERRNRKEERRKRKEEKKEKRKKMRSLKDGFRLRNRHSSLPRHKCTPG